MPPRPLQITDDAEASLVFGLARYLGALDTAVGLGTISNWQRLVQIASDENAIIALRDFLRRSDREALPSGVERYVAMLALDREFRMRQLQDRLERSLAALNAAGIDVLLLKGGALAATVYGSFSARPMRDIDLLVSPDRADDARSLMLELDWGADPDVPGDRSYGTHHHLPPLRDLGASGLRMEIHRALLPAGHPFGCTDEEIWREARRVRVGGSHALVMHPTHHAVHVAIHFAWSHMFKFGAWHAFRDLSWIDGSGQLDYDDFVGTARRWRAASCCYWTLSLARSLSGIPVEHSMLADLGSRLPELGQRALLRHLSHGLARGRLACPSVRLDRTLWSLAIQPRQSSHGRVRPWSVSQDLLFALNERTRPDVAERSDSTFVQLRRSSQYLSEILA
jgi:hypothetical protein